MEKLEICKKLSRLGWMSQAVIDNATTREHTDYANIRPILQDLRLGTYVHSIIMDKIVWSVVRPHCSRSWCARFEEYNGLGATIRDIA
jgi:hypothetical protein